MTVTFVNKEQPSDAAAKRGRSGTSSPYFDLETSIKVAEVIHSRGGGSATHDQLAAWLTYKTTRSGTYLTRIAAAKQFGFITSTGNQLFTTERAMTILAPVMPDDALAAKADAFLDIELFSKIYERFKGSQLPPDAGLKNLLRTPEYAVLPDRIDQALRVFRSSAEQAGFFAATGDQSRLIRPATTTNGTPSASVSRTEQKDDELSQPQQPVERRPASPLPDGTSGVHSAIVGLLRELPPAGTPWPPAKKQRFLSAFQATIDFIYPEEST